MAHMSGRTGASGPAFVRLLARLAHAHVPTPRQPLADRLSLWLGWTDAIALSAVLSGNAKAAPASTPATDTVAREDFARVRDELAQAIERDRVLRPVRSRHRRDPALLVDPDDDTDFSRYGQRCLAKQQQMETGIAALRGRLRAMLAAGSPEMARLAAVDAVMERVLGAQERNLLASVSGLLEGHFLRLRKAGQGSANNDNDPGPWLDTFRADMRGVLLAELDFRFQPVEGLLAALRAS
ncbi:MAG: hypothetical protein ABS43_27485 [Bordetella sp. SCN 67-23]|nr:DUF3348 domain-containing protein [Burkholderiales bacterium]ODS68728.1 MAG: hypothetical protein ABS43_27485 [Bordetella sp. SCN 67-23]ODU69332.1 MAG: hypothetical protein ABT00_19100 [Bordetella sp. SCN 68-11]OJW93890.1 MAG: hypothetical protein BGO71_18555 [Burkholderiales bacterium 67-32]